MEIVKWIGIIVIAMITGTIIQMSYDRIKKRIETLLAKAKTKTKQTKLKKFKKGEIIDVSNMSKEDRSRLEEQALMSMQQDIKKARLNAQICEEILKMMRNGCAIETVNKELKISCYYMVRHMSKTQKDEWKNLKHNKKEIKTTQIEAVVSNNENTERSKLIDKQIEMYASGYTKEKILIETGKNPVAMVRFHNEAQRDKWDEIKRKNKKLSVKELIDINTLDKDNREILISQISYARKKGLKPTEIEKINKINLKETINKMTKEERSKWDKL